jgi:hypothetical protein
MGLEKFFWGRSSEPAGKRSSRAGREEPETLTLRGIINIGKKGRDGRRINSDLRANPAFPLAGQGNPVFPPCRLRAGKGLSV